MAKAIETPKVLTHAEFEAQEIRNTFASTASDKMKSMNRLVNEFKFDRKQAAALVDGKKVNGINMNDVYKHLKVKNA